LRRAGVDFQIREVFESALALSVATLKRLGLQADEARAICDEIRRRDAEILDLQAIGDVQGARDLMFGNVRMQPAPLTTPKRKARPLSPETADAIDEPATTSPAPGA
jgi:glutathione-regulated potassium-efflux system protein KefB